MTLSPKLGVVEISTLWHFRLPLLIQMFIKVASSPRLSGIGMPSPILWSHLLKMQRIVLLSSHLWWELGTNSLITSPGEWLSLRRFTSKLSWSWSWSWHIWQAYRYEGHSREFRLFYRFAWNKTYITIQYHYQSMENTKAILFPNQGPFPVRVVKKHIYIYKHDLKKRKEKTSTATIHVEHVKINQCA